MSRPTFDQGFTTGPLAAVYSAESTVEAILEFEAVLAEALGEAGVAPGDETALVAEACRDGVADAADALASTWEDGTPLVALRKSITAGLGSGPASWFHFGATTQDAIDTAQMIQARRALEILEEELVGIAGRLRDLTIENRDVPQMGRTFLQDARPMTFAFRTATWLDAVLTHLEALRRQRQGLVVQLGGPVGTISDYGDAAPEVVASVARHLGLGVPDISWHANRSRIDALVSAVDSSARTMAKIGSDIALLASSPFDEVSVRSGGSSSMPEKQNPLDSVRAVAAGSVCSGAVGMLRAAPPHELDRAVGAWHVEWVALPLVFQSAGAAAEAIHACLTSLQVDKDRMTSRVEESERHSTSSGSHQIATVLSRHDHLLGS